jgi:hypothetical protein
MKTALITLIVIASFFSINVYSFDEKTELSCESLNQFYKLWSDSWFGKDPAREIAAWVIKNTDGNLMWIRWPSNRKWKKETWKGTIPANLIAQVHTHPLNTDPRPSYKDVVFSRNVKTTLYTISRKGIWKVIPNGTITEVAQADWHIKFQPVCADVFQLANDNGTLPPVSPMQYTKIQGFAWSRLHQDN